MATAKKTATTKKTTTTKKAAAEVPSQDDFVVSVRRSIVPILVGAVLAQAARIGLDLDPSELTGLFEALVTSAYYLTVRALETYYPQVGLLLGARKQPLYKAPTS